MRHIEKKKKYHSRTQIEVPCPMWLQKSMLKNLKKASTNKLWPERVKKASGILNSLNVKQHAPKAPMNVTPSKDAPATQTGSSSGRILTFGSRARNLIQHTLRGISGRLKTFVKKLVSRRIGVGGAFSGLRDEKYRIDAS